MRNYDIDLESDNNRKKQEFVRRIKWFEKCKIIK